MKTVLYFFLFSILFFSCQKQVDENKDLKKLNDDILFLLKKTDSLSSALALNISGISKISKKIDSLNNQLNIIQLEVAGLKEQLQNPAADVSFLTKKLDTLIVQYNLILEAINLLFYEISNSPGSISIGLEAFLPFRNDIKNYTSNNIWYKDGALLPDTGQKIKPTVSGSFTLKINQFGCSSPVSAPYYYFVTSVFDLGNNEFIKLAPNPFVYRISLDFFLKKYNKLNIENKIVFKTT